MNTRGVQNAQMQGSQGGPKSGTPEGMQFPRIEMIEGSMSTDGLARI
jgi:hypothetical protein